MGTPSRFIAGIYNYCDYVCEKCVFTGRCYLYWSENHPEEAAEELRDLADEYDDELDDFEFDELDDWDESDFFSHLDEHKSEDRTEQIIAPAHKIVELIDPVVDKLSRYNDYPDEVQEGIELVMENYILISVKYYRAVHDIDFDVHQQLNKYDLLLYEDAEKILLALKGFIWNLRIGLQILRKHFVRYADIFHQATRLTREIEQRIDYEFLPTVRTILNKYSGYLDED